MSDEPEEDVSVKKSGNKMVLVILLVNLVGLGGLGALLMLTRSAPAHANAPRREMRHHHVGPLVPMDPLIMNIGGVTEDPEAGRFLKVTVQFEAASDSSKAEIEAALVPIRNHVIVRFAGLAVAETQGSQNLVKLQNELKQQINHMLGSRRVKRVYFTDFVVQ